MKKLIIIDIVFLLLFVFSACNIKREERSVSLPDGVIRADYKISKEDSYIVNEKGFDIFKASAEELKEFSLASSDSMFGYVENARTAADIASIVCAEIYSDSDCAKNESPFMVYENKTANAWIVHGTLPFYKLGGVVAIAIEKNTGEVLMVYHSK